MTLSGLIAVGAALSDIGGAAPIARTSSSDARSRLPRTWTSTCRSCTDSTIPSTPERADHDLRAGNDGNHGGGAWRRFRARWFRRLPAAVGRKRAVFAARPVATPACFVAPKPLRHVRQRGARVGPQAPHFTGRQPLRLRLQRARTASPAAAPRHARRFVRQRGRLLLTSSTTESMARRASRIRSWQRVFQLRQNCSSR